MSKLFLGAIFAFLNFNLNFGDVTIGLLRDLSAGF